MTRYIAADDFLDLFYVASTGQDKAFIETVEMVVADTPTADVVEVVRCKDCVYRRLTGSAPFMFYTCTVAEGLNACKGDAFCSYGERRKEDGTSF